MLKIPYALPAFADEIPEIRVGDRFRETTGAGRIVRVAAMIHPPSGHAHARLRRIDDPKSVTTIACEALNDPRAYTKLARPPQRTVRNWTPLHDAKLPIAEGGTR